MMQAPEVLQVVMPETNRNERIKAEISTDNNDGIFNSLMFFDCIFGLAGISY
jgi:hypothetical protein